MKHWFLAAALLACGPVVPLPAYTPGELIVRDASAESRRARLIEHGVVPEPSGLVRFLEEGFDEKGMPKGLPAEPQNKLVLVQDAIVELGVTATAAGTPVLQRITAGEMPAGVERIIQRDFESLPVQTSEEQKPVARRLLSLSAIVSLGLIGDESSIPVIKDTIAKETGTAFITDGGIALAELGSADGLKGIIKLAKSDPLSGDSIAAFRTLFVVTGVNFGVHEQTSVSRRKKAIQQLVKWEKENLARVEVYRTDVLRRVQTPLLPDLVDPASLRGQLRTTLDLSNYDRRFAAREDLRNNAVKRFDELAQIAQDEDEDLDIRRAALLFISGADPKEAKSIIRRAKKDDNTVIAEYAATLERDIKEAIEYKKQEEK